MEQKDLQVMAETYREMTKMTYDFFVFKEQTKISLFSNQTQFFQTLVTINLALMAVLFATDSIQLNSLWSAAIICSLALMLFVPAFVRSTIDDIDRSLNKEHVELEAKEGKLFSVIMSAKAAADMPAFKSYLTSEKQRVAAKEGPVLSYAGEIILMMFYLSSIFTVIASIDSFEIYKVRDDCLVVVFAMIVSLSFLISFTNWSLHLNNLLSKFLSRIGL